MPIAHAKWFIDSSQHHQTDWGFFFDGETLVLLAAALVVAVLWYVVGPRLRRGSLPVFAPVGRLAPLMPRLLAGGLGLALVTLAVAGRLLGPGTVAESVPGGLGLTLVQGVVGAWLVLGWQLKAAAGLLGLLCLASAVLAGPMLVLESGQVVGVALYLGLISAPVGSDKRAPVTGTSSGARALGIALGVSLVVMAFTEKLGSPGVAAALLDGHPSLNVLGALSVSEATFIRLAGTAEVLVGLLLITATAPELVALTAAVPFLATVPVFGVTELVGHLPVYVALLALAVHAVAPEAAPAVAGRRLAMPRPTSLSLRLASREAYPALHPRRRPSRGDHGPHGAVPALSRESASDPREGRLPLKY
jgi:hypothetical protein